MRKDNYRSTILVISMGFLLLYLIFNWSWAVYVSLFVGLVGVFSIRLSLLIEYIWLKLSKILSYIVPTILLAVVFYFILFPIALISRLFTNDPLMLSDKYDSYFVDVKRKIDKEMFEKIW